MPGPVLRAPVPSALPLPVLRQPWLGSNRHKSLQTQHGVMPAGLGQRWVEEEGGDSSFITLAQFKLQKKRKEKRIKLHPGLWPAGKQERAQRSPASAGNAQEFHFEMMKLECPRRTHLTTNGKLTFPHPVAVPSTVPERARKTRRSRCGGTLWAGGRTPPGHPLAVPCLTPGAFPALIFGGLPGSEIPLRRWKRRSRDSSLPGSRWQHRCSCHSAGGRQPPSYLWHGIPHPGSHSQSAQRSVMVGQGREQGAWVWLSSVPPGCSAASGQPKRYRKGCSNVQLPLRCLFWQNHKPPASE